ncbi:hypothetical protein [Streptomyces sp. NPDC002588]|uniref:hypothetical protein n=1 Tax=Streptomyces sp. NPDC002588 TaxID=3154419 RepID=UPI00331DC508
MATEDARQADAKSAGTTDRAPAWVRGLLAYIGLSLAVGAVWMTVTYGAKVLAGVGWAGVPGRFEVVECVDVETTVDRGVARTRYCTGTFHPDDGGPDIEHVLIKGGRGDAYEPTPPGSRCYGDSPDEPWWCADGPTSVAARYLDGEAWTFGSGLWVPGSLTVLALCGFGLSTLLILHQLVWPDPGRRPRRLRRRVHDFTAVGGIAFVAFLVALAFDVNS